MAIVGTLLVMLASFCGARVRLDGTSAPQHRVVAGHAFRLRRSAARTRRHANSNGSPWGLTREKMSLLFPTEAHFGVKPRPGFKASRLKAAAAAEVTAARVFTQWVPCRLAM